MASADLQKFLDELRARISIVDVVGAKVKLVRKGREYQACCPFHNEKRRRLRLTKPRDFTIVSAAARMATSSNLKWKPTTCRLWMLCTSWRTRPGCGCRS